MSFFLQKLPFLIELFFNGSFIFLYSLKTTEKLPKAWSPAFIDSILEVGVFFVPIVLFFAVVVNYINSRDLEEFFRKYIFSLIVFIPLILTWGDIEFAFWLSSAHLLSSVLALYDVEPARGLESMKGRAPVWRIRLSPSQIVFVSFGATIFLGTFLLMLPVSSTEGKQIEFVDALFMAASATCVTGLSTISLADSFSLFGQFVILALIQIGGIGIMTLTSSMTLLLGKSMGMRDRVLMQDLLEVGSLEELFNMILAIIRYTFFIELWGGIILTIGFTFEGFEFGQALYYGFFHSISAFCNAGFSLFNTSLESYATKPLIHGTVMVLIVLGGFGFIVLRELKEVVAQRKSFVRIALHTKVVLISTAVLIAGGTVFIFFGEFLNALDNYTVWEKLQVALFQSVTTRTAGFNTIPLTSLHTYSIYAMAGLMFVGAGSGGTAGGVKITTFAILVQSIKATLTGQKRVSMFNRHIPSPMVVRATALTFISILTVSFFILILMRVEKDQNFLTIFFEVVSAFGTVGLSLGITPYLSIAGKIALTVLMFIGRIGPLTLVLAIGERQKSTGKFDYPDGRIMIG